MLQVTVGHEENRVEKEHLYQQIAEKIRNEILDGIIKPGEKLPSVRKLTESWNCTPGTIQRAYKSLADQGLVTSRGWTGHASERSSGYPNRLNQFAKQR